MLKKANTFWQYIFQRKELYPCNDGNFLHQHLAVFAYVFSFHNALKHVAILYLIYDSPFTDTPALQRINKLQSKLEGYTFFSYTYQKKKLKSSSPCDVLLLCLYLMQTHWRWHIHNRVRKRAIVPRWRKYIYGISQSGFPFNCK